VSLITGGWILKMTGFRFIVICHFFIALNSSRRVASSYLSSGEFLLLQIKNKDRLVDGKMKEKSKRSKVVGNE
jgi:hypothetical protein